MAKTAGEETSRTKLFELLIENPGEVVSSSRVTERLSASRQAVFKAACALRDEGLPVESLPQKGYRLGDMEAVQALAPTAVEYFLRANPLFGKFLYFQEADTTQSVIKSLARQEAPAGIVACAETQSAGRGRRGRSWAGTPGKNLTFSVLLRPKLKPGEVQLLNLAAGLAVKETLRAMYNIPAELKWPNDILCRGRKMCGILSEAAGEPDRIYYAATGIGLNVNMETDDLPPELREVATSALIESGMRLPRWRVLVTLLGAFARYAELLDTKSGGAELLSIYRRECDTLGKDVKVIQDDETFTGRAKSVTSEGALVVEINSEEKIFAAADVQHLRAV